MADPKPYTRGMASTPFTLAALATMAVPGLEVYSAREHTYGDNDELVAAALTTDRGEVIVRVPREAAAEHILGGELLSLAALSEGARAMLPFAIPEVLGQTTAGETRAVVFTYLPGGKVATSTLDADALLLRSIAASLGALHSLPLSVVSDAGLPVRSAMDARENAARLVRRAQDTRLVPSAVLSRWEAILDDDRLWEFEPTVIHGNLQLDQFLVEGDTITGILGWSALAVDDPAQDLAWVCASGAETFHSALAQYREVREISDAAAFERRAFFTHELELAKWLLHGVELHDQNVIDDAVLMFDSLVDRLSSTPLSDDTHKPLSVTEVESMLDETPAHALETQPIPIIGPEADSDSESGSESGSEPDSVHGHPTRPGE